MSNNTQATAKKQQGVWSAFKQGLVAIIMLFPRLAMSASKVMDVMDDVLDSGKDLSSTLRDTTQDYRKSSAIERKAEQNELLSEYVSEGKLSADDADKLKQGNDKLLDDLFADLTTKK